MNKINVTRLVVLLMTVAALSITAAAQKSGSGVAPEAIGIDIEQCANGPLAAPINCNISSGNEGYVRGNVNESKSHYYEGDFVPIRFIATDLQVGQVYTVTLGYDYTKGGKYATDYLGSYDYTEDNPLPNPPYENNPCVNVPGCNIATPNLFTIPLDPQVALGFNGVDDAPVGPTGGDDIVQIGGSFSCFGCTIGSVSAYTLDGPTTGDSSKNFTITFTANATNIVIAYGSHISTRGDWGMANSAVNISGSPYHNYVVDFPGANGGSRDLQLSASAVIFPANIIIEKTVVTSDFGATSTFSFGFTSNQTIWPNVGGFSLVDSVNEGYQVNPLLREGGEITSANITSFGSGNLITVTENAYPGVWTVGAITCTSTNGTNNNTFPAGGRSVSIQLEEGELVHCKFHNTQAGPTAAAATVSGRVVDSFGNGIGGARLVLTNAQDGTVWNAISSPFGYYTIEGAEVGNFYVMTVAHKRYAFSDDTRTFTLNEDLADLDFVANP